MAASAALSAAMGRPISLASVIAAITRTRTKSRKRPVDVLHRVLLQCCGHVGIGVGRNADLGVPENLLNHSELDSRREQERRARVSRIVETLVR